MLFKVDVENSGTPGCIKHIKSKNIIKKIDESKSYKTWVSGMCDPNKLLKIWSMLKKY